MGHTSGSIDPVFGQSKVFDCSDKAVNPNALKYLKSVRNEALYINAISSRNLRLKQSRNFISYNDVDDENIESNQKQNGLTCTPICLSTTFDNIMEWFYLLQKEGQAYQEPFLGYDECTLNLVLYKLKQYIKCSQDKLCDSEFENLSTLLEEVSPVEKHSSLELDSKWTEKLLSRLKRRTFANLENLKSKINSPVPIPTRNKAWKIHISLNEPTHEFFQRMSRAQLFELLHYMQANLEEELFEQYSIEHSQWLLYLLLHFPQMLSANEVSQIRSLGKLARKLVFSNCDKLTSLELPVELAGNTLPTSSLNIIEVTLVVVGIEHGQRDLLLS